VLLTAWAIVTLLVLANALYVAAEFGAVGVRRSRVRRLAEDGNPLARWLLPFVERPAALVQYTSASQIGITLSSLALGAYGEARFGEPVTAALLSWFDLDEASAHSAAAGLILLSLTAFQIVIGELLPKSLALQYPTETALATILPMRWSLVLFRPFNALLNGSARLLLMPFGATDSTHRHIHSPDELELLIAESRDGGLLEADEHRRLHQALRLGLRTARDLMVPLSRVTMLRAGAPWAEVVHTISRSAFSRLPVYRDSPQHVVGTLRVKDLVAHYAASGPMPLERLVRPIADVREDLPADRVVSVLRERRAHQAIVQDARGRAVGLVTIQDVLSELLDVAPRADRSRPA
jgi:CBS domain containing-hemolysin-like protein